LAQLRPVPAVVMDLQSSDLHQWDIVDVRLGGSGMWVPKMVLNPQQGSQESGLLYVLDLGKSCLVQRMHLSSLACSITKS